MKVTIEFSDEDAMDDAMVALNGSKWRFLIYELQQKLRETTKYDASILDPKKQVCSVEYAVAEKYEEFIREIVNDSGLSTEY